MYQKPEAEERLTPAKEASLMDRWYTKIEAICVEADKNPSLLFQEAGKYFENQVSSAGQTMRKVCSELIRDLLPPSEDECKHLEKCQCKCEASKKKAAAKPEDPSQTSPPPAAAATPQDHNECSGPQLDEEQKNTTLAPQPEVGEVQAAASTQAEESDTVVELGDQIAQWYITDEYKRSTGIVENWDCSSNNNPASSRSRAEEPELDSDWEIV